MQVSIRMPNVQAALRALDRASGQTRDGIRRALFRIGATVKRTAVRYAPISPSKSLLQRFKDAGGKEGTTLMSGRGKKARAVTLTKFYADRLDDMLSDDPRSVEGPKPGGLMRSITFASDAEKAEIFVPSNSDAGKYARRIHDDKGISWWKRGPGTQAKGPKADDRFILRAITDNEGPMLKIIDGEMRRVQG